MLLCEEDKECGVCYQVYTRWERVPRMLHCRHTFCTPCLKRMSQPISSLLSVRCPLCRWTTCIGPTLSLQEALWVDSKLWDQISENEDENGEEEEEEETRQTEPTAQPKSSYFERYKLHLEVPAILRKVAKRLQVAAAPVNHIVKK